MKNISLYVFALLVFTACETTLDIELPDYKKQMVAHSFVLDIDDTLKVQTSTTVGLLESTDYQQDDRVAATAEIYEDDQLKYSFSTNTSVPITDAFVAGRTYRLVVNNPELGSMEATQIMSTVVPFKSAKLKKGQGFDGFGDKLDVLEISFDDPSNEENYYEANLYLETIYSDTITYLNYLYPSAASLGASIADNGAVVVSDRSFAGQSYTLQIDYYEPYTEDAEVTYYLVWQSISKDRYLYLKSVTDHIYAQDDPFAEPVSVYSNFTGGLGIFALGTAEIFEIEVE